MARITVEDCLSNVDNRFDLVLLASRRASDQAPSSSAPNAATTSPTSSSLATPKLATGKVWSRTRSSRRVSKGDLARPANPGDGAPLDGEGALRVRRSANRGVGRGEARRVLDSVRRIRYRLPRMTCVSGAHDSR